MPANTAAARPPHAMLDPTQVRIVAAYVHSLSNPSDSTPQNIGTIEAARQVALTYCAACNGEDVVSAQSD